MLVEFDRFFGLVALLPITAQVFDLATELRARQELKTADALHLATAIVHGCTDFWTNDLSLGSATSTLSVRVVPESKYQAIEVSGLPAALCATENRSKRNALPAVANNTGHSNRD
ncbi:MAG: PIN domain-containing protein [Aphanocapsa lilacina HA4352-LM1]|nr:PIN domain-containing protein [Aphanocapsa lilacina HA4352-LM1]